MKNGRVEFLGAKPVLIAVGERGKGIKKSGEVRHYERTVDFLARYNLPSDGSQVLLKPGTKQAFDHFEVPYPDVPNHATLEVVPNKKDQVDDRPEENKMALFVQTGQGLRCRSMHANQQCEKPLGHNGPHQECMEVWNHA